MEADEGKCVPGISALDGDSFVLIAANESDERPYIFRIRTGQIKSRAQSQQNKAGTEAGAEVVVETHASMAASLRLEPDALLSG